MAQAFGFRQLQGKGQAQGHIRSADEIAVSARGLIPGEEYSLFCTGTRIRKKQADARGTVSFSPEKDGFFFLCDEKNALILWESFPDAAQGYYQALKLLPKKETEEKPAAAPVAPPAPEQRAEAAPSPAPSRRYRLMHFRFPSKKPALPPLRSPSNAPLACSLPVRQWPKSLVHIASVLPAGQPFSNLGQDGFRCVQLPCPNPAFPYCVVGFQTKGSCIRALLYALPGHPMMPPRGFAGSRWQQGHWLRIQQIP